MASSLASRMEPGAWVEVVATHSRDLARDARRLAPLLSRAETERAERYRRSDDRSRFIIGRGLSRSLLGEKLAADAGSLSIEIGPSGKPFLAGGPCFSISHSGIWVAIALSNADVGIDIEERVALDHLPLSVLSQKEQERVLSAADPVDAFLAIWVAKEAVLKLEGRGLPGPTAGFTVPELPDSHPHLVATDDEGLRGIGVAPVRLSSNVNCAVAAAGVTWSPIVRLSGLNIDDRRGGGCLPAISAQGATSLDWKYST